ncbi:MAG: DNA alkylation repair protein [Cytophagaceae bacterium]|jgi:hypothetical protein|nr:DNA alkylation repair protein [Cytophagaceae bacterium]
MKRHKDSRNTFREGRQAKVYGVKIQAVNKITKDALGEVKCLTKTEIFALCEALKKLCVPCG